MAKAGDKSSTSDRIWLSKALVLATARFGSEELAKRRLREWLKSRQLPWSSRFWTGPDAETIARLDQLNTGIVGYIVPSGPYHQGDPQFWSANLAIDWEKNDAREKALGGAIALGIWVMYSRLLALLPEKLRNREKTPEPTDAEVPALSANAPAASPAPPRNVSEAELRGCILNIVTNHPPDTAPPDEKTLVTMVESRLGVPVSRNRIRQALKDGAPHFKRLRGRPRTGAQ